MVVSGANVILVIWYTDIICSVIGYIAAIVY